MGSFASAGENLFAHLALLNALDLRLRAAEIVVAGEGAEADDLVAAARKLPFLDRIVLRAASAARCRPRIPHRRRSRQRRERRLHLRRRNLLVAGDTSRGARRDARGDAPLKHARLFPQCRDAA